MYHHHHIWVRSATIIGSRIFGQHPHTRLFKWPPIDNVCATLNYPARTTRTKHQSISFISSSAFRSASAHTYKPIGVYYPSIRSILLVCSIFFSGNWKSVLPIIETEVPFAPTYTHYTYIWFRPAANFRWYIEMSSLATLIHMYIVHARISRAFRQIVAAGTNLTCLPHMHEVWGGVFWTVADGCACVCVCYRYQNARAGILS